MRKLKIILPISILVLINLFVFIGLASWIIPSHVEGNATEDISGLVQKYLGGQSVTETGEAQLPLSKDENVITTPDYESTWYKTTTGNVWTQGGPTRPGTYYIKYSINNVDYIVDFTINNASAVYVAYINSNTSGNQYTTVETALTAATSGDKVWIIPRDEPTYITINCTIKEGVTLNIPYGTPNSNLLNGEDPSRIYTIVHSYENLGNPGLEPPSHTEEVQNLKNNLIISQGITLTNNGTINIGGVVSGGYLARFSGYNAKGCTDTGDNNNDNVIEGHYSQISLNSQAKIISNGVIHCHGYIVDIYSENSNNVKTELKPQIIVNGGEVHLPFIVAENRQGARFANIAGGIMKYIGQFFDNNINLDLDYVPFNRFYFQNIPCLMTVKYGASVIGNINMYANNQNNASDAIMIGTNSQSLIQLKSEGYVKCEYTINRDQNKDSGASVIKIDIFGGCTVNDLALTITADLPILGTKNIKISSKGLFLPISWYYDITLNGGGENGEFAATYDLQHSLKLLPGSKITVGEKATLNAGSFDIIVYNNNLLKTSNGSKLNLFDESQIQDELYGGKTISGIPKDIEFLYDVGSPCYYPNDKGPAHLIINGKANVNKLGGLVETQNTGAVLNFKSNYVTSLELKSIGTMAKNSDNTWTYTYPAADSATSQSGDYGSYLSLNLYNSSSDQPVISGSSSGNYTYYSNSGLWTTLSELNTYTISYETYGLGQNVSSITIKDVSNTYTLTYNDIPVLNEYHYNFLGWFDESGEQFYVGKILTAGNYKLYAKWEAVNYPIIYRVTVDDGLENPNVANSNIGFINIENIRNSSNNSLSNLQTDTGLAFSGWYLSNKLDGVPITSISEQDLEYLLDGNLFLYGEWKLPELKIIDITFIIYDENDNVIINTTIQKEVDLGYIYINPSQEIHEYSTLDNNDITKPYYLDGWYFDANYTSKVDDVQNIKFNDSGTIYAKVFNKTPITIKPVIKDFSDKIWYIHESLTLPEYTDSKLGFNLNCDDGTIIFDGWLINSNNSPISSGSQINVSEGMILTAKLTKSITITLNPMDGTLDKKAISLSYDYSKGNTEIGDLPTPTLTGYTFLGWYTDSLSGTIVNANTKFSGNSTIYAHWEIKTITVTFNAGEGTFSDGKKTITRTGIYGDFLQEPSDPSVKDKNFEGWEPSVPSTFPSEDTTYTAKYGGCITGDTLITLFDGSKKMAKDLLPTDLLLVFNHETGKYEGAPIIFNDFISEDINSIINLQFSDGTIVKVVYEHGFFDLTLNKYVYIGESNMDEYIGHMFYQADYDGTTYTSRGVELVDAYITEEFTTVYSPITVYHFNYFTEGMISLPADIEGLFNIFEFGENLTYDQELMQKDIETYGLFTYEDFAEYVDYEVYCLFPAQYFKVAIGKGMITFEEIEELIYYYFEKFNLMK